MGNYRPVIHYDLSPYTRAGFASAYDMSMKIFDQADIKNYSSYSKRMLEPSLCPDGRTLTFNGAGHFAGTHCMGGSPESSVVNKYQRTWEHPNLYLVGCGNMINMGTSNPTLTMSALTCWAAHNILQDLNGGIMRQIDWQQATAQPYDAVIVGSGFAGCIMAKQLTRAGRRVLIVEAGTGNDSFGQHLDHVQTFMQAVAKTPNAPYPNSPNAPQPEVTDVEPITPGKPSHKGYFVQMGPIPSKVTIPVGWVALRCTGSAVVHGCCLSDFAMATLFGRGVDWPLSYEELLPYYQRAELEIGVSADVQDQQYHGIYFAPGYQYPMQKIPQSYLDRWMIAGLAQAELPGMADKAQIRSSRKAETACPMQVIPRVVRWVIRPWVVAVWATPAVFLICRSRLVTTR